MGSIKLAGKLTLASPEYTDMFTVSRQWALTVHMLIALAMRLLIDPHHVIWSACMPACSPKHAWHDRDSSDAR